MISNTSLNEQYIKTLEKQEAKPQTHSLKIYDLRSNL